MPREHWLVICHSWTLPACLLLWNSYEAHKYTPHSYIQHTTISSFIHLVYNNFTSIHLTFVTATQQTHGSYAGHTHRYFQYGQVTSGLGVIQRLYTLYSENFRNIRSDGGCGVFLDDAFSLVIIYDWYYRLRYWTTVFPLLPQMCNDDHVALPQTKPPRNDSYPSSFVYYWFNADIKSNRIIHWALVFWVYGQNNQHEEYSLPQNKMVDIWRLNNHVKRIIHRCSVRIEKKAITQILTAVNRCNLFGWRCG